MEKIKTVMLIFFSAFILSGNAQIFNGIVCSGAVAFTPTNTPQSVDQVNNDGWLAFTAYAANISVSIKNNLTANTAGKIVSMKAYSGSCGNLVQLSSDTISLGNDTLLTVNFFNCIIGNTYFVYTLRNTFPGQCNNIPTCTGDALFDISGREIVASQCHVYGHFFSVENCGADTVENDVTCTQYSLINPNQCAFTNTFCFSPATNSLYISYGVDIQGGMVSFANNFVMEAITDGVPSTYVLTSPNTTLAQFPFLSQGSPPSAVVHYTINVYAPGQYGITQPCNSILISLQPGPDPDFTLSSLCAGVVCFQPNTVTGHHSWVVTGQPNSNLTSPCYNLAPGTYTVCHQVTTNIDGVLCTKMS